MFITFIFSSTTLIVRLVNPTKKHSYEYRGNFSNCHSSMSPIYNYITANILFEDDMSISYIEKESITESDVLFLGNTHKISNMIIVLALETVFFNIALLIFFVNMSNLTHLYKENKFKEMFISKQMGIIVLLIKFSIPGLLFVISEKMFRAIMCHWFCDKCFVKTKSGIRI